MPKWETHGIDRRIKIRHVTCFAEILRQGSFKEAAARLSLTQPAISKTLRELEEIVGTPLLERSRAGVAPTREGEVFAHYAQLGLAALREGLEGVERARHGGGARLSVGVLPSVAARLMPVAARIFDDLSPGAVLALSDGPHEHLQELLRDGSLDLVLGRLGEPETMQGLSFTQLYREEVVFAVRPGHPLLARPSLAAMADYQVLFPGPGAVIRPLVERLLISEGVGLFPHRIETVSGAFGRNYVPQSDAVWIISEGVVSNELAAGRLARLAIDTPTTLGPVGLVSRPETEPTPEARVFRLAVGRALRELGLTA